MILSLRALPIPVIAAVNGQAAGAGFSLVLACDLRVVSERTRLHFAYGSLPASTDGGMSWLLPRTVGPSKALSLLLEQPIIRGQRALVEGLATELVPAADLQESALRLAKDLSHGPRHSVAAATRLVRTAWSNDLADHMREEHRIFAEGLLTDDMAAALVARRSGDVPAFR